MNATETILQQQTLQVQLLSLAKELQSPMSALRMLNNRINKRPSLVTDAEQVRILVENSRKIVDMVGNLVVNYTDRPNKNQAPIIFALYNTVPSIKTCCSKKPDAALIPKTDLEWLVKLERIVFEVINKRKINLIDLAYELAVSERQLHRNIKKFLGLTPNNYIRILKLHQAKQYLENYEFRTIAEVSYAVGFGDCHYFKQIFRKQYGVLPKAFRPA